MTMQWWCGIANFVYVIAKHEAISPTSSQNHKLSHNHPNGNVIARHEAISKLNSVNFRSRIHKTMRWRCGIVG